MARDTTAVCLNHATIKEKARVVRFDHARHAPCRGASGKNEHRSKSKIRRARGELVCIDGSCARVAHVASKEDGVCAVACRCCGRDRLDAADARICSLARPEEQLAFGKKYVIRQRYYDATQCHSIKWDTEAGVGEKEQTGIRNNI